MATKPRGEKGVRQRSYVPFAIAKEQVQPVHALTRGTGRPVPAQRTHHGQPGRVVRAVEAMCQDRS